MIATITIFTDDDLAYSHLDIAGLIEHEVEAISVRRKIESSLDVDRLRQDISDLLDNTRLSGLLPFAEEVSYKQIKRLARSGGGASFESGNYAITLSVARRRG